MWQIENIQVPAGLSLASWQHVDVPNTDRPECHGGGFVEVDFSAKGNSAFFRGEGWSSQEPDMIWAVGPRSRLRIPFQAAGQAVVLEADVDPCRKLPEIAGQFVRVHVNGHQIGDTRLDGRTRLRFNIEPDIAGTGGMLDIVFEFPGFFQPKSMRYSQDERPLSGAFHLVRAYTKDLSVPAPRDIPAAENVRLVELSAACPGVAAGSALPPATAYRFGLSGNVNPFLRGGWHAGEDEATWTIATSASIELPGPAAPGAYVLRLDVVPMIVPGVVPSQDVTIVLDRMVIGQYSLSEPTTLIVPLPRELTEDRFILPLSFFMPDACRPQDHGIALDPRLLGLCFRRIGLVPVPPNLIGLDTLRGEQAGTIPPLARSTKFLDESEEELLPAIRDTLGVDPIALMKGFESLGNNCEFGIAQRKMGVEVLNLFRFGNVPFADLMTAVTDDLAALTEPGSLSVELNQSEPREYLLSLPKYNIHWHTFVFEHESTPEKIAREHAVKLAYLRRKFFEGLESRQKIYVVKRPRGVTSAQAAALLLELGRHGAATLLCVQIAPPGRRSGEVEYVMPGFMRGYLDKFADEDDVEAADALAWLRLTANAAALHRETQRPAG